jgi:hypothetical protein
MKISTELEKVMMDCACNLDGGSKNTYKLFYGEPS